MFDKTPTTMTEPDATLGPAHPLLPAIARAEVGRVIRGFLQTAVNWNP
jgi:hypothetical protein